MTYDCNSLPILVGALSSAIANNYNADELAVLSAVFVQLGDSLALIVAQRALEESCNKTSKLQSAQNSRT